MCGTFANGGGHSARRFLCAAVSKVSRIPIYSGQVFRREAGHRSDLKPSNSEMKPVAISISGQVSEEFGVFVWVSPSGIKSLVDQRGKADAGQERTDHATDTTNATTCP
jgi:hypothetical protein